MDDEGDRQLGRCRVLAGLTVMPQTVSPLAPVKLNFSNADRIELGEQVAVDVGQLA